MAHPVESDTGERRTLGSHLPAWAALLFGLLVWANPRLLAERAETTAPSLADFPGLLAQQVLPAIKNGWFFAAVALVGLMLLLLFQIRRRRRLAAALSDPVGTPLRQMSRTEFKRVVARAFRRRGYGILQGRPAASGQAVDLEVTKDGKRYLVQCGYWREWQVGVEAVQDLGGLITENAADGVFVVISGEFTRAAERFAAGRRIKLVDLHRLRGMAGGPERPASGLSPAPTKQLPAGRPALAGLAAAALAVIAMGGALWWAPGGRLFTKNAPVANVQTISPSQRHPGYRADTPILPTEIRMDFPAPGELQSSKPMPRPSQTGRAAAREKIAQDLEADFEASYHPPAYCDNWQSREQMVACGNDRIRAWKAYQAEHWALRRLDTARAEIPSSE